MKNDRSEILKALPAIGALQQHPKGVKLQSEFGAGRATFIFRCVIESVRRRVLDGHLRAVPATDEILDLARTELQNISRSLSRRVVNATGIVLHTGLGRAPLCKEAVDSFQTFTHYTWLEVEPESGERGRREMFVERLLIELTGCEAACVVNNNAAAVFLCLKALASGKEVVVSRGQLIEIGGAFRMPDVMAQSGAILKEIGTTNKTHKKDYEDAVGPNTAALMHVHPSNYRIHGFASTPSLTEICEVGRKKSLPVIDDLGGGALVPLSAYGVPDEPLVSESIKAGCDIVCFSGDKIISGPQAGILIGKKTAIEKIRRDSFFRMLRPDKILLAALEASLLQFLDWPEKRDRLSFHRIVARTEAELEKSAKTIAASLKLPKGLRAEVVKTESFVGGGAIPDQALPSAAIKISDEAAAPGWAESTAAALRMLTPAVLCRINDEALLFDTRCLLDGDDTVLKESLEAVLRH